MIGRESAGSVITDGDRAGGELVQVHGLMMRLYVQTRAGVHLHRALPITDSNLAVRR
jgi:hypothetical protein